MQKLAKEILNVLHQAGFEAYIVGGYVRDYLIGSGAEDIDFCTNATPMQISELFTTLNSPGIKYGTCTIVYKNKKFEITTYRKELHYLKHRSPETVEYIEHIEDDLKRRDFTINAMCMDESGNILDPLNGRNDLDNRVIRAIGDADTKIDNDSLRILRAIRFATVLDFHLDFKLELAIIKYKENLKLISYEVKKHELDRILLSSNKFKGIELLKKLNLTESLDITIPSKIKDTDLLGMYAQLEMDKFYPLTKHEKESVSLINEMVENGIITKMNILENGIYLTKIAASILEVNHGLLDQMYQEMPIYAVDELKVKGEDITKALNIEPGPIIKAVKNDIIKQIIYHDLANSKRAIKNYLLNNKSKWYNELG